MYVTHQAHVRSVRYVEVGTLRIFLVRYTFFLQYIHLYPEYDLLVPSVIRSDHPLIQLNY